MHELVGIAVCHEPEGQLSEMCCAAAERYTFGIQVQPC